MKSCPLAERMKLSASSRRPSSFKDTRGSAIWMLPCPDILRLAPPSPASSETGSSRISAVLGLELGVERDGDRNAGRGDLGRRSEQQLGLAGDVQRPIVARRERDLGVDIEPRMIVAAARKLDLDALVGRQFARDQPKRHAAGASLDAPGPNQLLAFDEDVLGIKLIGPAGTRHLRGDEKLPDLQPFDRPFATARAARSGGRRAGASFRPERPTR